MADNSERPEGLEKYRQKRDPQRTPEPFGRRTRRRRPGGPGVFVVQLHAAKKRHYDFRIELGDVLVSWVIPKGPSLAVDDKRLAVMVENHPLDYATFEGLIPEGNYGAGAVIVWDMGVWIPAADPVESLEQGKLDFTLRGYKLRGQWTLVRTSNPDDGDKSWLLCKKQDAFATSEGTLREDSVLSGLTVEEVAGGAHRGGALRAAIDRLGARRRALDVKKLSPMLCQTAQPFSHPDWLFELKYDGYRLLAAKTGSGPYLRYRSGLEATHLFPDLARAIAALPYESFIVDGEVVVFADDGRPDFHRLQQRSQLQQPEEIRRASMIEPVTMVVFDILAFEGYDLRPLKLSDRKALVKMLLPGIGPLRYAEHIEERGAEVYAMVVERGLEGVVAKRADSTYQGARSDKWLKIRSDRVDDFAICGYTSPQGSRVGFGALHLTVWNGHKWVYAGKVGTGFNNRELQALAKALGEMQPWEPTFAPPSSPQRDDNWVEPRLVCTVKYADWPEGSHLRFPSFLHLRGDKRPKECLIPAHLGDSPPVPIDGAPALQVVQGLQYDGDDSDDGDEARDKDGDEARHGDDKTPAGELSPASGELPDKSGELPDESGALPRSGRGLSAEAPERALRLSNLDKPLWPATDQRPAYTKGELISYYRDIAPWILPYLHDRPLVMVRYPNGIDGESFFQKDAPAGTPSWIRTETLWSKHAEREVRYIICDDADTLVYLANLGAITLHVWSSRVETLSQPDWAILDLDPKGAPFAHVLTVARALYDLCCEIELPCFIKSSGSTGLHVLIPLAGACTYEQSRNLAMLLAKVVESEHGDIATTHRRLERRDGKVYLDYVQNGHGKLIVAPLSVRALPGAPVSMPLRWSEVTGKLDPQRYTIKSAPSRLRRLKNEPLAEVLEIGSDLPKALELLARRMHK